MRSLAGNIYVLVGLMALLLAGVSYYGSRKYDAGAAAVQARWDQAKAIQTRTALAASESAREGEFTQAARFNAISSNYLQATSHAYPSIADALPAAVDAGTVRLRNDCPAAASGAGVSAATARARDADAAATQALAERVEAAIAAVRVGEAADARERQLGAQVTALQAVVTAERSTQPRETP